MSVLFTWQDPISAYKSLLRIFKMSFEYWREVQILDCTQNDFLSIRLHAEGLIDDPLTLGQE